MRILLLISIALLLPGCGYSRLALSKTQAFFHSTPENIKAAAPENCLVATGRINGNLDRDMPLAVAAVTRWEKEKRVVDYCLLKSGSPFFLYLHEGDYQFLLFADINHDSIIEESELIGSWNNLQELRVDQHNAARGVFKDINISADINHIRKSDIAFRVAVPERKHATTSKLISSADITTPEDERFSEEISFQGLYKPSGYLEQVDRFFYMQEEYDPTKIPVIFVHGMEGTPKDWSFFAKGIDKSRFQAWFFYYPSGLRMETAADIFYDIFLSGKYTKTKRLVIAAHSQGGLVARTALNRLKLKNNENTPQLFISFCTPYGGVTSAALAISKKSPVIIPSWIDLASSSIYMKNIFNQKPPSEILFHLFFAYGNTRLLKLGPNDDGAISLKSQLDNKAQKEAVSIRGFDETHSSILSSKEALDSFNEILKKLE